LGIDPTSFERDVTKRGLSSLLAASDGDSGVGLDDAAGRREDTKVLLVREDPRKISATATKEEADEDDD
jgi:hypothetical protein